MSRWWKKTPVTDIDTLVSQAMQRRESEDAQTRACRLAQDIQTCNEVYAKAGQDIRLQMDELPQEVITLDQHDDGTAVLSLTGPVHPALGNFTGMMSKLVNLDAKSLHMEITSPGGAIELGLGLANAIRTVADRDIPVSAHALGVVASAGVLPFLAADERSAAPGSAFMTHKPFLPLFLFPHLTEDSMGELTEAAESIKAHLVAVTNATVSFMASRIPDASQDDIRGELAKEKFWTEQELRESRIVNTDAPSVDPQPADAAAQAAAQRNLILALKVEAALME